MVCWVESSRPHVSALQETVHAVSLSGQRSEQVMASLKKQRFFVAFDVQNLWMSCQEAFGATARVDFRVLSELLPGRYENCSQELVAYVISSPQRKGNALALMLRTFGICVRERFMRFEKALSKPTRTDWDVGIAIEAIDRIEEYDVFVLGSGDGDFSQLLEYLKKRGKETMVLTFKNATSRSLYSAAGEVIHLEQFAVFTGQPRK